MKVVVAGIGYVGLVTGVCLAEKGHNVICVDINTDKIEMMKNGKSPIYEPGIEELMNKNYKNKRLNYSNDYKKEYKDADVIIIAVGTPEKNDGSANLDYVYEVVKQIASNVNKDCIVVIKSTVPIGTNDEIEKYLNENKKSNCKIEVVSNPEFLSQGTAIKDTMNASRIVIGTESENAKKMMKQLYKNFDIPILFMKRRSSEMVKYASNDFLALKISYMNDIANLCEIVGANIDEVTNGMSYDQRIGNKFLKVGCGYGGSCFPKDTKALYYLAKRQGYDLKSIEATIIINKKQKMVLLEKAKKKFKTFKEINVAILGIAFKPNTDDLRDAPALDNINLLLKEKAKIKVFDPKAIANLKKIYSTNIEYVNTPQKAIHNADVCFIFTEWNQVKEVKPIEYYREMRNAVVYDGRNIYDIKEMKKNGVEYYSIGRQLININIRISLKKIKYGKL